MKNNKWSDRDWTWLVGILITIMISMVAIFYNSDKVEMNFSIISSAVSIALAIIAIFIALRQASDNQQVNINVSNLLNQIEANLRNVGEKVNSLDLGTINQVKEETVEDFKIQNESKESYTATEMKELVENFGNDLTKKLLNMSLKKDVNRLNLINEQKPTSSTLIRNLISKNPNISAEEIYEEMKEQYGLKTTYGLIYGILNNEKKKSLK